MSSRSKRSEPDPDFDALFSAPADRFIAVRDELAARAKSAGRQDLAIRLKSMKRPPVVVWLANALAREAPEVIQSLLDAGVKLRSAYSSNDQKAIREATQERHRALGDAIRHGRQILTNAGHSLAGERRLARVLIGASMDAAQGKLLAAGRLAHEIEPPRLGSDLVDYPAPKEKRPSKHDRDAELETKSRERARAKELRSAERAAAKAKRAAQQAARAASRRAESAVAAQRAAESAEARARELQSVADQRQTDVDALRRATSRADNRSKLR